MRRSKTPTVLGFTFRELCELDTVKVELVPEKKGLILKHVEYEVTSQNCKATVLRRYNDFVSFYELLMTRFPYRMIPSLPPKKMMGASREFIEQRRKSLRRFLNLIARHPQIYDDKLVLFFFTFNGSDMQHKIKEAFRGIPDEFMTSNLASQAKDLVPMDTQVQLGNSKEHIRILSSSVSKLKDIAERMVMRATSYACDMLQFGQELSALIQIASTDRFLMCVLPQAADEAEKVVEKLALFQDLLLSYKELCERHEKGVLHDHQRAIQKMGQYKKKKMSATVGTSEVGAVEQLEQKILQQESQIANMENRNYYSLHCLQMETQLIYANVEILYDVLGGMAETQARSHTELSRVWNEIRPIIENVIGKEISSRTSPVGSSLNNNHAGITL
ncbi:sorting nexin-8-like [Argopecten irradians]|uniref:sorting nexin-8-like n=1 Tax=Argopecten irradians TaxID=31199 RepID=UPI0037201E6B